MAIELDQKPRGWARFAPLQFRAAGTRQVQGAARGAGEAVSHEVVGLGRGRPRRGPARARAGACCASELGLDPAAGAAPGRARGGAPARLAARRRRARAAGGGRGGGARARRPRRARRATPPGAAIRTWSACARGDAGGAPDAVVEPGSADEVRALLAACAEARVAVVPFGGGTSVVGGVDPVRGRLPGGDLARPAPPRPAARGGPHLADGHARGRPVRPRGRAAAGGRGT